MRGQPGFFDIDERLKRFDAAGSKPPVDIAIPTFGYQNHISIDPA